MNTKTFTIEQYLSRLQLEIIELRQVVSGLYQAGSTRQSEVFTRYEELLNRKCNDYCQLRQVLTGHAA